MGRVISPMLCPHRGMSFGVAQPCHWCHAVRAAERCPRDQNGAVSEMVPCRVSLSCFWRSMPYRAVPCRAVLSCAVSCCAVPCRAAVLFLVAPRMRCNTVPFYAAWSAVLLRVVPCCLVSRVSTWNVFRPSSSYSIPSRPVPSHPIPSRPVPSRPVPSRPVPSRPIPSHPIPSHPTPPRPRMAPCVSPVQPARRTPLGRVGHSAPRPVH